MHKLYCVHGAISFSIVVIDDLQNTGATKASQGLSGVGLFAMLCAMSSATPISFRTGSGI
jgi:hypothetical protein